MSKEKKVNCKGCRGINNSLTGDYCLACISEALKPIVIVPQKQALSHTNRVNVPHYVPHCKLCPTPRAKWSHSYCKQHEAERKAKQRSRPSP